MSNVGGTGGGFMGKVLDMALRGLDIMQNDIEKLLKQAEPTPGGGAGTGGTSGATGKEVSTGKDQTGTENVTSGGGMDAKLALRVQFMVNQYNVVATAFTNTMKADNDNTKGILRNVN